MFGASFPGSGAANLAGTQAAPMSANVTTYSSSQSPTTSTGYPSRAQPGWLNPEMRGSSQTSPSMGLTVMRTTGRVMATDSSATATSSVPAGVQTAFNISRRSLGTSPCPPNPTAPQGIATASAVLQSVPTKSGETDVAGRSAKALHDARSRRLSRDPPPPTKAPQQLPAPTRSMGDAKTAHTVGSATSSMQLSSTPAKMQQSHTTSSPQAATTQTLMPIATSSMSLESSELQQEVEELRRARESANARQAELVQLAGAEVEAEASATAGLAAIALATEVEGLMGRVGVLEHENAQLVAASEAAEQAARLNLEAAKSEAREFSRSLETSFEELSKERARSKLLESELDQAHARVAADAAAEVEELRRCVADLEQSNVQLRGTVERLSQEPPRHTNEEGVKEALEREHSRAEQFFGELERVRTELSEARAIGNRAEGLELDISNGSHGTGLMDGADCLASSESLEVRLLRAELAKRDRELLAAASARRRTADQSERTAAALRAKLAELEAIMAATPSVSSRASSPPRSEGGSPFQLPCADRGIQTDLDALSLSAAVDVAVINRDTVKSLSGLGARLRVPSNQACDDVDKAVTAELLTGQGHNHNSIL